MASNWKSILTRATKGREMADKKGASHRNTVGLIACKEYAKDVLMAKNEKRAMIFISTWKLQLAELMPGCKADNLNEINALINSPATHTQAFNQIGGALISNQTH